MTSDVIFFLNSISFLSDASFSEYVSLPQTLKCAGNFSVFLVLQGVFVSIQTLLQVTCLFCYWQIECVTQRSIWLLSQRSLSLIIFFTVRVWDFTSSLLSTAAVKTGFADDLLTAIPGPSSVKSETNGLNIKIIINWVSFERGKLVV